MSIATIVFDFGNVVSFFSHRQAAEQLAAFGRAPADAILAHLFNGALEDEYESGRISSDAYVEQVCRTFGLTCSPAEFARAYSDMFTANDAVCSLLPRLQSDYRLLLLSNTTELHSRHFLAQFAEQMKWFDHLVLSHEVGVRKPQPAIYEHCRKLVGCRAEECVFIDDVATNVEGAKACGWHGIVYRRGDDLAEQLAQLGVTFSPLPCTQGRGEKKSAPNDGSEDDMNPIERVDPDVWQAIAAERRRQQTGLEMIASENYTSPAVLAAQGSELTNKYAEGYPGRRYYGGCEYVDVVERLAIERVRKLFGAEHANVQPHSGAQANMAVYFACLQPGDTILAMNLAHGGHLTHGMHLNFSGKLYKIVPYGVRKEDERIDMDQVAALAKEHKPKLVVAGASAYSRIFDFAAFADICKSISALFMVDMAHIAGLVAGEQHPSPVPWADFVTSTTHKTLRGPRAGFVLTRSKEWAAKVNSAVFPGMQGGPLMHVIAAKAIGFKEALDPSFRAYAAQTIANAKTVAHELSSHGFRLVSGGTDNHLLLVDVTSRGLTGKVAEKALDAAGITVNRNAIPWDQRPPLDPSGIRIGTPALTTRGMRETEMRTIAGWIGEVLGKPDDTALQQRVRGQVGEMRKQYPAPAN